MEEKELKKLSEELNSRVNDIRKSIDLKADSEMIEGKFTDMNDRFGELKGLNEKAQEQLDKIATEMKQWREAKGSKPQTTYEQLKSMHESEGFKGLIDRKSNNFDFTLKANNITETLTVTDDSTNNTRVIAEQRDPGILVPPRPRLTTWDLVNKQSTNSRLIQYTERYSETDGASMIGTDGSAGSQSDASWKANSVALTAISSYSKIHRDMLEDFGAVQAEINEVLNFNLAAKRNNQILTGTGAANQLKGLIYASDPWATAFSAPTAFTNTIPNANYFDVLRAAILQVNQGENTDYRTGYMPNAIVLNPEDAAVLDMLVKATDGQYIIPPYVSMSGGFVTVKGVPIVEDPFMTQGTYLVGDFTKAQARIRRGIELRVWESNEDDALNNLLTITATHRLGFFVKSHHAEAFVYGTFSAGKSAIEEVTA